MPADPFAILGLGADASIEDVRSARRRLAKTHHPDHGGDESSMRALNAAFDAAVKAVGQRDGRRVVEPQKPPPSPEPTAMTKTRRPSPRRGRLDHDASSFTVSAPLADSFEALVLVTAWFGEVAFADGYECVEVRLEEPAPCWARLTLMTEAGATTVSVTVICDPDDEVVTAEDVRDRYVVAINELSSSVS